MANEKLNVDEILSLPHRQDVATKIDKALGDLDLSLYEVMLGFCDFASTILTLELSAAFTTPEEKKASEERVSKIREQVVDIFNKREAKALGEEMVVSVSMLAESVVIGLNREKEFDAQEEKQPEA